MEQSASTTKRYLRRIFETVDPYGQAGGATMTLLAEEVFDLTATNLSNSDSSCPGPQVRAGAQVFVCARVVIILVVGTGFHY